MTPKIMFMYIIIGTTFNILYMLVYLTNAHALLSTVIFSNNSKQTLKKKRFTISLQKQLEFPILDNEKAIGNLGSPKFTSNILWVSNSEQH